MPRSKVRLGWIPPTGIKFAREFEWRDCDNCLTRFPALANSDRRLCDDCTAAQNPGRSATTQRARGMESGEPYNPMSLGPQEKDSNYCFAKVHFEDCREASS